MTQRENISGYIRGLSGVAVALVDFTTGATINTTHSIADGYWEFVEPGTGKYNVLFSGRNTIDSDDIYGIEIVDMSEFESSEQFLNDTPPSGTFGDGAAPITHVITRIESDAYIQWTYTPDATNKHQGFVVRWEHGASSSQAISGTSPSRKIDSAARDFSIKIPADNYVTIKVYAYFNGVGGSNEDTGYQHANWVDSQAVSLATLSGWDANPSSLSKNNAELNSAGYIILGDQAGNDVVRMDATHASYRQWIGHKTDPTLAAYAVEKDGTLHATGVEISGVLTATTGYILGTLTVGSHSNKITIIGTAAEATTAIYAGAGNYGNADTGFYADASGRFSMGAGLTWSGSVLSAAGMTLDPTEGIYAGADATRVQMKAGAGIWAGATAIGSAPFNVTMGGVLTATTGNFLGLIYVGATSNRIKIDGAGKVIGMEDFVSGSTGWEIDGAGNSEFNNTVVRGNIAAQMFVFQEMAVTRGTQVIAVSAGELFANAVTTGSGTFNLKVTKPPSGSNPLGSASFCVMDDGTNEVWFTPGAGTLTGGTHYNYTATWVAGAAHTFTIGTAIADYGISGQGGIILTADRTNAPYIDIFTHAGAPQSVLTTRVRIGNTKGFLGETNVRYGIAIGESTKYLKYNPTDGLIIRGDLTADTGYIGGPTGWTINTGYMASVSGSPPIGMSLNNTNAALITTLGSGFEVFYPSDPRMFLGNSTSFINWNNHPNTSEGADDEFYMKGDFTLDGTFIATASNVIQGGIFKTAASLQRIEMGGAGNNLIFYDDDGEVVIIDENIEGSGNSGMKIRNPLDANHYTNIYGGYIYAYNATRGNTAVFSNAFTNTTGSTTVVSASYSSADLDNYAKWRYAFYGSSTIQNNSSTSHGYGGWFHSLNSGSGENVAVYADAPIAAGASGDNWAIKTFRGDSLFQEDLYVTRHLILGGTAGANVNGAMRYTAGTPDKIEALLDSAWVSLTAGGGTVTSVGAGTGIIASPSPIIGVGTISADFGSTTGKVCEGDDARLSDARVPSSHQVTSHTGGAYTIGLRNAGSTGPYSALAIGINAVVGRNSSGFISLGIGAGSTQVARGNHDHGYLPLSGGTMAGSIDMDGYDIYDLNEVRTRGADGAGYRFWNSDDYSIHMSADGNGTWGGYITNTADYNMYFRMKSGTARGFVFMNATTALAQLTGTLGDLWLKGGLYVGNASTYGITSAGVGDFASILCAGAAAINGQASVGSLRIAGDSLASTPTEIDLVANTSTSKNSHTHPYIPNNAHVSMNGYNATFNSYTVPDEGANEGFMGPGNAWGLHHPYVAQGGYIAVELKIDDPFQLRTSGGTLLEQITTDGERTLPLNPAFLAYNSVTDSNKSVNTYHPVEFNTEVFDQGGDYNNGTDIFTAPVDGKYQLNTAVRIDSLDTGASNYRIYITTTKRRYQWIIDPNFTADLAQFTANISVTTEMDDGDTAFVEFYQSGGLPQSDIVGVTSNQTTVFSGFLAT